jgi:hypothetical protein
MPIGDGGKRKWDRVPACRQRRMGRVALKDAGRRLDAGRRYAVGLSAILDRHPPPCAKEGGRDGGWSIRSNTGMGEKVGINFLAHS